MPLPTALTIAGSDAGGGAGIQADLKAMAAVGVHGASAITCVTSQNTLGVDRIDPLPVEAVVAQIDSVLDDLNVQAVKTGMLHTPEVVTAVARRLEATGLPVVVDPVMVATSGDALHEGDLADALDDLAQVTTLITPNTDELTLLTDHQITTLSEAREAGRALHEDGWQAVLVKGGHLPTEQAIDLLVTENGVDELAYPRATGIFHGAGCTYASLIAGLLARGYQLDHAVGEARARMHRAINRAYQVGKGPRVLDALEAVAAGPPAGGALSQAAWQIAATLPAAFVPEVGINIAHGPDQPQRPDQVLGLARRITTTPTGPGAPGAVVRGASGHVARVLLAAQHHHPEVTVAMNLAYAPDLVAACQQAGLQVATFSRTKEPAEVGSTMEWGTGRAIEQASGCPDLVADDGGKGKEAMIRVLATSPADLVTKVEQIASLLPAP